MYITQGGYKGEFVPLSRGICFALQKNAITCYSIFQNAPNRRLSDSQELQYNAYTTSTLRSVA